MTTVSRPAGSRRLRDAHSRHAPAPAATLDSEPATATNPHRRGGRVLFGIHFTSTMASADLELLRRQLDMTTHVEHKLPADPNSPAVARLDQYSGLFLERGDDDRHWLLQARTWGAPLAQTIHEWHVRAAQVVRQLDPAIALPERVPTTPLETPQRLVGPTANGRLTRLRRRLAGLS